jgi:acetyl-CoA carboxylase carboxyltransferase component
MSAKPKVSVARARLSALFDDGRYDEYGASVVHQCTDFGLQAKKIPGDGVVTAIGRVGGRPVVAFSQDRATLGGSLGLEHARKITRALDMALDIGAPFVGINDSGGARIQEGIDSLAGYGEIFYRNVAASGRIPQISIIAGPCAGGAVYSPALTDFVVMVENNSYMFLTGPKVVKTVTFEETSAESLGGGRVHFEHTGVAHLLYESDLDAIDAVRSLLSYLPSNANEEPPRVETEDDPDRSCSVLDELIPNSPKAPYDVRHIIESVLDQDSFFETSAGFAANIVVGFGRLNGYSIGIVANQPDVLAGVLDIPSSRKAARFIRTCDAFNIPIVTLVDVPGFLPGVDQEHGGAIVHGAKLLYAYCEARVPKLTVITRKAFGGAYIVMGSKHVGGDVNLAWPMAQIAVMGAPGAVEIIHRREIVAADDPEAKNTELKNAYEDKFMSPRRAAERGYIDAEIRPSETRRRLVFALDALVGKERADPQRRHGNLPT